MGKKNYLLTSFVTGLATIACFNGCSSDSSTPSTSNNGVAPETFAMPSELQFKNIQQEFQQQQQQVGPLCPKKFVMEIDQTGKVSINNQQGQQIISGKVSQNDLAKLAITANDVVSSGTQEQVDCGKADNNSSQQFGVQQTVITDKSNQDLLVSTQKDDSFCDFSKSGKGAQMQQQMGQIAQQSCTGQLPQPTPTPSASASPSPTPSASPSITPTPSPTPSATASAPIPTPSPTPTPTPSPSASAGGEDTASDILCRQAVTVLSADFKAAKQCSADTDCNYIQSNFAVIDRGDTSQFISQFRCGDETPRLTVANGTYVQANSSKLMQDINSVSGSCDLSSLISSCRGSGGFESLVAPVCVSGACQKSR